jgi:hypothetical protein
MKKRFILTGFTSYKNYALLVKARHIIESMTGNTSFPTPVPALTVITTAADNYSNALAMANGKQATQLRAKTRTQLMLVLKQLGAYVNATANGDAVILAGSGFDLNKVPGKIGVLPAPQGFKLYPLTGGVVKLRVKKVHGAYSYNFQYAQTENGVIGAWQNYPSQKTEVLIDGLQRLSDYAFRVAGIGAASTLTYSEVITSGVL